MELSKQNIRWIGLAIVAIAFLVFGRALGFEFLSWDDEVFIAENPLVHSDEFFNTYHCIACDGRTAGSRVALGYA